MPKLKPGTIWPAPAKVELTQDQINKIAATDMTFDQVEEKYGEEIAIQVGIARDPDAPEWTAEDFARARPVVEIDPEFVETHVAHKTAQKLRDQGYDVSTQVPLDFFHSFPADIIVRERDKTRIIQVKTRSSIAADRRIAELAYTINSMKSKPGWTFELILVGEPAGRDAPPVDKPLGRDKILKRIERAQKALDSGLPEAALLLALSACEATLRTSMADEGRSNSSASYALKQALNRRTISWDECLNLADLRKQGNAITHGFTHAPLAEDAITRLIQTALKIATKRPTTELAPDRQDQKLDVQLDTEKKSRAAKWFAPTRDALDALLHDSDPGLPGSRPTETSIRETLAILAKILDNRAPPPSVVPTYEGGVQVEWHRNGVDLEIEISPDGNAEYFFASPNEEREGVAWDEIERLTKYAQTVL